MKIKKLFLSIISFLFVFNFLFTFSFSSSALELNAITTTIISPENIRIWFVPGSNWTQGDAAFKIENLTLSKTYNQSGVWYNSQTKDYPNGVEEWQEFVYFDIPQTEFANGTSFKFLRFNSTYSSQWNYGNAQTYSTNDNSQVYYYPYDWWDTGVASRGRPLGVDAGLAVTALAGYLSCESDGENGYGVFNQVANTWIHTTLDDWTVFKTSGNLNDHNITDYDGVGSIQYSSARIDSTVDGLNKYLELKSNYLS